MGKTPSAAKIRDIHANPVEAGWVLEAEHHPYTSASNHASGEALLAVRILDLLMSWMGYVPGT